MNFEKLLVWETDKQKNMVLWFFISNTLTINFDTFGSSHVPTLPFLKLIRTL